MWVREAVLARSSGSACWEWDGDTYRTYLNLVHGHVPFAIGDESLYDSTRCGCGELLTYAHLQVCKRARHRHHTDKAPGAVDAGLGSEVNRHHAVCDQLAEGLRRLFPGASVTREQTLAQHVPRLDVLLDFGAGEKYGYDVSFKSLFKANGTPAHPRLLREGGWAAQKRDAEKVAAYAPMQGCEFVPVSFEAPTARPSACFVRHIEHLWRRRAMRSPGGSARPSRRDLSAFTQGLMQVAAIAIAAMVNERLAVHTGAEPAARRRRRQRRGRRSRGPPSPPQEPLPPLPPAPLEKPLPPLPTAPLPPLVPRPLQPAEIAVWRQLAAPAAGAGEAAQPQRQWNPRRVDTMALPPRQRRFLSALHSPPPDDDRRHRRRRRKRRRRREKKTQKKKEEEEEDESAGSKTAAQAGSAAGPNDSARTARPPPPPQQRRQRRRRGQR